MGALRIGRTPDGALRHSPRTASSFHPGRTPDTFRAPSVIVPIPERGEIRQTGNRRIESTTKPGAAGTGDDIMTRLDGGTRVKKGYYFEMRTWELQPIACDGEPLPGTAGRIYFHVPLLLVLVIAPLMGAAFVLFLPCIGFYLVLQAAFRPLARLFHRSATEVAATVQPGWQPGEAHLTGRRGASVDELAEMTERAEAGEAAGDDLAALEREIAAKRREQ